MYSDKGASSRRSSLEMIGVGGHKTLGFSTTFHLPAKTSPPERRSAQASSVRGTGETRSIIFSLRSPSAHSKILDG